MKRALLLFFLLLLAACGREKTVVEEVKETHRTQSEHSQGVEMILQQGQKRVELDREDMRIFRTFMMLLGEMPNQSLRLRNYDHQVTRNGKEIIGFHFTPEGELFVRYQEKEFSLGREEEAAILLRELYDEVSAAP